MNKKQKLFWVILSYILLAVVVGIINPGIGAVILITTSVIITIILLLIILWAIYLALSDDGFWY